MTRHWQGHDGRCVCGLAMETRGHIFWDCPATEGLRRTLEAGQSHHIRQPRGVERELGLPMKNAQVEGWRADWVPPPEEVMDHWSAQHLFVDASAKYPKFASIRTVGWAITDGELHARGGVLPPGANVAWGECLAVVEAYNHCRETTTIWSDCQAAVKLWRRCQKVSAKRYAGGLQALLPALQRARKHQPAVRVEWIPSHKSQEEFVGLGHPLEAWYGNEAADKAAKERAAKCVAPVALVELVSRARQRATEVARVVADVQLARLQQRQRTDDGGAVKARRRREPGGLRRGGAPKAKRACLRREAGQERPGWTLKDLLMPVGRAGCPAEEARRLVDEALPVEGFHDLRPVGPWPFAGSWTATNGRLMWSWLCSRCNASAGDSSRAGVLAKKPCGELRWQAEACKHDVVQAGVDEYLCSRCGRHADAAHRSSMELAGCVVPRVRKDGVFWSEGERALGDLLGRIAAFRRWAEPDPVVKEAAPELAHGEVPGSQGLEAREPLGAAPFLAGYRGHKVCVVSRRTLCAACHQVAQPGDLEAFRNRPCEGNQPGAAAPGFLVHALRRNGAVPVDAGTRERLATLAALVGAGRARSAVLPLRAREARRPEPATTRSSAVGVALLAAGRLAEASRRLP